MRNLKEVMKDDNNDEHLTVLESARMVLKQATENREEGRKRLENALQRYKERAENGPFRNI